MDQARSSSKFKSLLNIAVAHGLSRKDLRETHVNMMAFSTCVGVGLFLQGGRVMYLAGPGLAILAYLLGGSIIWSTMASLGEMTALFPIEGPVFAFTCHFLDEAMGYAIGWLLW